MEDYDVSGMDWNPSEEVEPAPAIWDPSHEVEPQEDVNIGEEPGTEMQFTDDSGTQVAEDATNEHDDGDRSQKPDDSQISPRPYPRSREVLDNDELEPQPDRTIRPPKEWIPGGPERGG